MTRLVDPKDIHGGDWQVVEVTPTYRRSEMHIGNGQFIQRTEFLADEELVAMNKQEYDDSHGKRWGDGRVVARIPLNVLFSSASQISQKAKEGDKEHLKWWLNSETARPFRTFKGRI